MPLFFADITRIEQFTRSLPIHQSRTQCRHCLKQDQFVSHGFVYKQRSITWREAVGKRLLCSNRYGRSGCGRTVQLRVADCIPHLHYSAAVVSTFIDRLLDHCCVSRAYQRATGQYEARHAWRWITKLIRQLMAYRCSLNTRTDVGLATTHRSRALSLLLPTLREMRSIWHSPSLCASYQQQRQVTFM